MSDIQAIIKLIEEGSSNSDHRDGQRQINEAVAMLRDMEEDILLCFEKEAEEASGTWRWSAVDGLDSVRQWLKKHNQQKAEAAETEKRNAEAVKKEEQGAKKTCGVCKHIYDTDGYVEIGNPGVMLCHKKSVRVPIEFTGCRDFEPVAADRMTLQCHNPASEHSDAFAERIAQLEAENANLKSEIRKCNERVSLSTELSWKCERLAEQRNRLSKCLIEATRRVKELEQRMLNCEAGAHGKAFKVKFFLQR